MSSRELLKAIGEIDERFIDEAAEVISAAKPAARRVRRRRWVAAAACLIVAAGIGVMTLPQFFLAGNKAATDTKGYSINNAGNYNPAPEKSLYDRGTAMEEVQASDLNTVIDSIVDSGSGPMTIPEDMVFRDAPRSLWLMTLSGR